ncbi:MAG: DUF4924 family protein [Bacteroidales bacterium]|nr:DUF4924 family protein [Bacteroidales bacterium]MCM1147724.1 DUF4924 family protein [Bacteroidales bacterium]MCM1206666.1 DUF4924 family protein [Bacillota bacterium]MCM1510593.1 DUF4924 family protein [Clostridium sp.]
MFISKKLRKENIAEYLLYMWQVEDIIRAFDCYMPALRRDYISKFDCSDEDREDLEDWYSNLIRMMTEEGCRESGHLQINNVTLQTLAELHGQLLGSPKFPFYSTEYYKVLPFIVELRNKGDKDKNEIETCLDALYGVMMLRLQKQEISEDTLRAVREITTFVGMLSDYYKKDKEEGLEF